MQTNPARVLAALLALAPVTAAALCPSDFTGYGCRVADALDAYVRWEREYHHARALCDAGDDIECDAVAALEERGASASEDRLAHRR